MATPGCDPARRTRRRAGFTLIEILITLCVFGILMTLGLRGLGASRTAQLERNACDGLPLFIAGVIAQTALHPGTLGSAEQSGQTLRGITDPASEILEGALELPQNMRAESLTLSTDGVSSRGAVTLKGAVLRCTALSSRSGDVKVTYGN